LEGKRQHDREDKRRVARINEVYTISRKLDVDLELLKKVLVSLLCSIACYVPRRC
jgi:hypothetical protein